MTFIRLTPPRFETLWFAVIASLVMVLAISGFVADPFGWRSARMRQAEAAQAVAASDRAARALEAQGATATVRRVEGLMTTQRRVGEATTALAGQAVNAIDADEPIGTERVERLRRHDEALCRLAELRGCEDQRTAEEGL